MGVNAKITRFQHPLLLPNNRKVANAQNFHRIFPMQKFSRLASAYNRFDEARMPTTWWNFFVKSLALTFTAYWWHLHPGLSDWLGTRGFHLVSPTARIFVPLSSLGAGILWWLTLTGGLLLLTRQTTSLGCAMAGAGLFYATMCDPASTAAVNMHFLFALLVIFWSTDLKSNPPGMMPAWPAHLIRLYLVVVYFGSGWRKVIYGNWLNDPNALFQCLTGYYVTDSTRWLWAFMPASSWVILQFLTVAFELGAPLLLLYPPLRRWGVIGGCLLHLGIALLMRDILYFSFQMLTLYIPVLTPINYLAVASSKSDHQSAT
jgi:hypothetical protein